MANHRPAVLIVDDDRGTLDTFQMVLTREGFDVGLASSGRDGLTLARSRAFDLWLIDFRLGDMLGLELSASLRRERPWVPFVLISAWLTTEVTVEAMKLGAANVIEKPLSLDDMRNAVVSVLGESAAASRSSFDAVQRHRPARSGEASRSSAGAVGMRPRSTAERWAQHVLKACDADGDLKNVDDWALCAGISASSLSETCHLLNIHPRDARDFARVLRALVQSRIHQCDPQALLDVSDRRTLAGLLERAGGAMTSEGSNWFDLFLARQRFVDPANEGVRALRLLL